jgi:4-carboxymuconolactone decarboxylase
MTKTNKRASSLHDRMPAIPASKMTHAQKRAAQVVIKGPRGALIGPFVPALRSPEFMVRLQALGEYLRYRSALGPKLGELVILLTARLWTQNFEWSVHAPLAKRAGLKPDVIEAIAQGMRPLNATKDEALVIDFFTELTHNRSVCDATYARAVRQFGEQAVIDMIGAIGYYSTLAMIMNVAAPVLDSDERAGLLPFPK